MLPAEMLPRVLGLINRVDGLHYCMVRRALDRGNSPDHWSNGSMSSRSRNDEMLIAALEHPSRDVQSEAVRRMIGTMRPAYAEPLARWLMRQTVQGTGIHLLVVRLLTRLPDSPEKLIALSILRRHPSRTVQLEMLKSCRAPGPAGETPRKGCRFS